MKWLTLRRIVVVVIGISVCSLQTVAGEDVIYRFRSGVHISKERPLTSEQVGKLLAGLRRWTGLNEIAFDDRNQLITGDREQVHAGSATARDLLSAAVDSKDSFTVESHDNSPAFAFAQIEAIANFVDGEGARHNDWVLRIDFADFNELGGNHEALAAFDPAASFLHEMTHGVLGYLDQTGRDDYLGECEKYINRMRAELDLPQRLYYYPEKNRVTKPDGWTFLQGKLSFVSDHDSGKNRQLFITFNLEKVFDLSKARSRAEIEASLIAQKSAQWR